MSVSFVKLFTTITDSSVWSLPDGVRVIWITLLSMANSRGNVHASIVGVAGRARKSIADVEEALAIFTSPDPYSRTKDHDGRRIVEIDGGWNILNYAKHHRVLVSENARESKRAYAERAREQARNLNDSSAKVEFSRSESNSCSLSLSSPLGFRSDPDLTRAREAGVFDAPTIAAEPQRSRFAPDDFLPTVAHCQRCLELRFDIDALLREFKACEFNRPYSDWHRRFSRWIEDHRVRAETERSKRTYAPKDRPNQGNHGVTGFENAEFIE